MNEQLKEFFYNEQDQGRLDYEADPEYSALLHQTLALFPEGDLPDSLAQLLDISNCLSFAHGLKLGLKLNRWALR